MQRRFDKVLTSLEARLRNQGSLLSAQPEPLFLLAVSGGVDSMCLADLFMHSSLHPKFAVAHCNFRLRGKESDADEAFVRAWAEGAGVPFRCAAFDTEAVADERGISVEMAARELRYRWFDALCRAENFVCTVVAHHLNDKAETLVLNLLRGTGIRGMSGMEDLSTLPVGSEVPLIRPLLGFPRSDLLEYARAHGLSWREDRTNADASFKRNCIRNRVFPLFERLNPSFLEALDRDMAHLREVQDIADAYVASVKDGISSPSGNGIDIRIPALRTLRHVDYVLYRLLEPYGFTPSDFGNLQRLLREGGTRSGRTFHSQEYSLVTTADALLVRRRVAGAEGDGEDCLKVSGPGTCFWHGCRICVSVEPFDGGMPLKQPAGSLIFDGARLPFPFPVRRWRAGDWMQPLGLRTSSGRPGRKKLSDLFVDLKLGLPEKEKALVIADEGSHVKALLGWRIDDAVKVTASTVTVVRIRITGCR